MRRHFWWREGHWPILTRRGKKTACLQTRTLISTRANIISVSKTPAGLLLLCAVGQGGYYNADGVLVTSQGYYLSDGTFVEGRYVEGSVFSGGTVTGNTVVTGGGIVSLYGFEETRTTTTATTNSGTASGSVTLTAEQRGGGVKIQADGTPYYCWCAYSADGARVPVYSVASPSASVPRHYVGGGKKTFDIESYYEGFWKVSWRETGGGVQYGWVREEEVACKRTLTR